MRRALGVWIRTYFGVDLRALAALRVALGTLVLVDLAIRSRWIVAHYTDGGVFPRVAALARYRAMELWSLHLASGGAWWQGLLFLGTAVAAFCMVLGLRTRLAVAATWLLVYSLQVRNPLLLQGADDVLRQLLFFSVFLPMGARWSLDAWIGGVEDPARARGGFLSVGTVALLAQCAIVYLYAGVLKDGPAWTVAGDAIRRTLHLGTFTRPLGAWLAKHAPELLDGSTGLVLVLERFGPLMLFLPWTRPVAILGFTALQAGIFATMRLGFFPFASAALMIPFLPPAFWDAFEGGLRRAGLRPGPDEEVPASLAELGRRAGVRPVRLRPSWGGSALAWVAAAYVVAITLVAGGGAKVNPPQQVHRALRVFRLNQNWSLFAPQPVSWDAWYVMDATFADGRRIDLQTGEAVDFAEPERTRLRFPGVRWRKFLRRFAREDFEPERVHLGKALCREQNEGIPRERAMENLVILEVRKDLRDDLTWSPTRKTVLWRHFCFEEDLDRYVEEQGPEKRVYR